MSPPTPVFGKDDVDLLLKQANDCKLKSLTQNDCSFIEREYICIPFKRLFQECIMGTKKIRIEVTDYNTNR